MLKIMRSQPHLLGLGFAVALITATTAPVSAQNVIVIDRGTSFGINQPKAVGSFIYGSPIPTPMPVNPATGLMPSHTYYSYPQVPSHTYYSSPQIRHRVIDSTLVNPILVNPKIQNSTLINPVIVNDSWHRPAIKRRHIYTHPW